MSKSAVTLPIERIERAIIFIRGEKVILDSDLARLYGVSTARLNQQVNRNLNRFPEDFMFRLTEGEFKDLMLQNATSKKGRGGEENSPTRLPSTAPLWQPTSSVVSMQFKHQFRLCEPLFNCARSSLPTPNLLSSWMSLKRNTTHSSRSCSTLFVN